MDEKTRLEIAESARKIADGMAKILQQEYRVHLGQWWLFTLGKPARPLTAEEISYAQERGKLPK